MRYLTLLVLAILCERPLTVGLKR